MPAKALIPINKQQQLALPGTIIGLFVNLLMVLFLVGFQPFSRENFYSLVVVSTTSIFLLLVYFWMIPWSAENRVRSWLLTVLNCLMIAAVVLLDQFLPSGYAILFRFIILLQTAILIGRGASYTLIFFVLAITILMDQVHIFSSLVNFSFQDFVFLPLAGILVTETGIRLQDFLTAELRRMQTLNQVARSLASSLESHQVMALVSSAVQNAMDADTYYVGMLKGDSVHLELLYDDGEFFPSMDIPLKDTLAGQVVKTRKALLIRNLIEAHKRLNLAYKLVGKPRISQSWMGVPLESHGEIIGLIAVASYKKNAFDEGDLELLGNIAQQAAMALDNAGHHLEVENRSQLDSLTGALNHNTALARLDRAAIEAASLSSTLSLIMVDIDHFKNYNDSYGHLIGDQVLILLTQTIQHCVKKSDIVGRWGGEEFLVGLPHTDLKQAFAIAERIRHALASLNISDRDNCRIPAPTISQGIAYLPLETDDVQTLIDLADQRLYQAKERGRNQIEPEISAEQLYQLKFLERE